MRCSVHRCSTVTRRTRGGLCVTLLLVIVADGWSAWHGASVARRSAALEGGAVRDETARQIAGKVWLGNFDLSLEARENADFLLTPALLVQEALREDIIITYPTE